RGIQRFSPAPPRHRNHVADRGVEPHERCEGFLDEPGKGHLRPRLARVDNGRHMMNYIAERRCLDEKDVGHGVFVALIYRSLRTAAMPSGGAIKTQFLLSAGTLPHARTAGVTPLGASGALIACMDQYRLNSYVSARVAGKVFRR